jgi:hypothetical protein
MAVENYPALSDFKPPLAGNLKTHNRNFDFVGKIRSIDH